MSEEKTKLLISTVKGMREAQKTYFRFRSNDTLRLAKRYEKDVDRMLDEYDAENQPKQQNLFE